MGARGPKPQPTHLKLLRGNPGKRAVNRKEAKPEIEIPECPDFVTGPARDEWQRIAVQLHDLGLLAKIDAAALAAYCVSYGRWANAEVQVRKTGTIIKSPNGFPMVSPALSIAQKAMANMMRIAREFGMTPSSRSSIQAEARDKDKKVDPAEEFFGT